MSGNTSESTLAAKREARRKRILENAESRLRKLTGVEQKSHVIIDDFKPIKYDETNTVNHHDFDHTRLVNEVLPDLMLNSANQVSSTQPLDDGIAVNGRKRWKYNKLNTIISIALLSNIVTLISTIICDEIEWNIGSNMIFLPFLGFKCLEYYLLHNIVTENNIFQLILMANMKNDTLKRMFTCTQYLASFTQDLCIYFFIFVCINQVFRVNLIFR